MGKLVAMSVDSADAASSTTGAVKGGKKRKTEASLRFAEWPSERALDDWEGYKAAAEAELEDGSVVEDSKAFGDRMRELFVKEWGEGGAPFWSTNQATKAKIKADTARFMSQVNEELSPGYAAFAEVERAHSGVEAAESALVAAKAELKAKCDAFSAALNPGLAKKKK